MSDHNHENPLDSILNGNNEVTEANASANTPDLSPGLIDTVTTNKLLKLFQSLIHSQEDTAENTHTSAACGESCIPDNNSNGTHKSGGTPKNKCAEELEQDYKKDPLFISNLLMCLRIGHGEYLNKTNGARWQVTPSHQKI